ncbi:hypothetical protein DYB30_004611 [Aphanomyces astaci]|uniref:Uncharacterized protein n=2 Tax=Aphanomyces astaci TaxID=112090 RepID=A0A397FKD5_APHAT|nr:hypothetical protein DYB30_004611 [Aphanomyces astaci]RHY60379.1 hypothetical protein DYB38_010972 [Aphanomyces astaci]RHZ31420.1 hypothetical protein DYB31_009213 [Aphanomyces astaci]RHZ31426.1 hypothetical protein DYB31_004022 [Aphanomyces astaci]
MLPPAFAWTAAAAVAFLGCVEGQAAFAAVATTTPKRGVTTCSSLHGPHCFAVNERNVPSYLLHGNAIDGQQRQPIPHIQVPQTKKLASHGFADDVLFGGISIQSLQPEDAQKALAATANALKEWMQRQPGYSESMLHTAIQVAAKKIEALIPTQPSSSLQPPTSSILTSESTESEPPMTAHTPDKQVVAGVGNDTAEPIKDHPRTGTLREFSDDDVMAFMLLSREEKSLLLEFDTARTRRLIKAQGQFLRGYKYTTKDSNDQERGTLKLVDKALQDATQALKQRLHDAMSQQATDTRFGHDNSKP